MLIALLVVPLIAALLCALLSRFVPTRLLGILAAASLLISTMLLIVLRLTLPQARLSLPWLTYGDQVLPLTIELTGANWVAALLPLGGGTLALLALALALAPDLRHFGGLFAALTLALTTTTAGLLGGASMVLPISWSITAIAGFVALRASGSFANRPTPPGLVIAGQAGALLLITLLFIASADSTDSLTMAVGAGVLLLAVGLAVGSIPTSRLVDTLATTPAALAATLLGLGLPLLGAFTLLLWPAAASLFNAPFLREVMLLFGLAVAVGSALGAIAADSIRRIAARLLSANIGLVIMAAAVSNAAMALVAPAILLNGILATLVIMLALVPLERAAGNDSLAHLHGDRMPPATGLLVLIGITSTIGLPGTLGMWSMLWLYEAVQQAMPWAIGPLLAVHALLLLATLAPLAMSLIRTAPPGRETRRRAGSPALLLAAIAAFPLLLLGSLPHLLWEHWLIALREQAGLTADTTLWLPDTSGSIAAVAALVLLIGAAIGQQRLTRRHSIADPDLETHGIMTPTTLAHSLGVADESRRPREVLPIWEGLQWISEWLHRLSPFEQRYYLAGLVISLIVLLLLFF